MSRRFMATLRAAGAPGNCSDSSGGFHYGETGPDENKADHDVAQHW